MKIFEKQLEHLIALLALLALLFTLSKSHGVLSGTFLGMSTLTWYSVALAAPILHQVFVWITWRTELHYSLLTRIFGRRAFLYYAVVFMIFLHARLILITGLAISNQQSLQVHHTILYIAASMMAVPVLYVFYSVLRYFGLKRALGIDHFDPSYKDVPLVRQGIYKYVSNAMYYFGLFILWIPGLIMASKAALLLAIFQHLYIWAHYYFVEMPDMRRIYADPDIRSAAL